MRTEVPTVVHVVVREGLEAKGIRALAEKWGTIKAVKVDVQTLGRENYEVDITNDILGTNPKYDVLFFPGTLVAEMAGKRALASIDGWSAGGDPDLLAYSSFGGKVYGLPCDVSTFFFYYRDDVVSVVPDTWDDLLNSAPKLRNMGNPPTAYGLAFAGKAGEELPKIFYPMLWSHGGFIIEEGRVGLDTPGAIAAAELLKKFASSGAMPPDLQAWDVGKILDELQRGTVAVSVPQWNALFPLIRAGSSSLRSHIQIAALPGVRQSDGQIKRVNFRQTWTLVKSAGGKHQELANEFILYATGREGARVYAQEAMGNPARTSILADPELQRLRPEFPLMLESLKVSKAEPEVRFYAQMQRVMNEALSSILAGTGAPASAMAGAAEKVRALQKGDSQE